MKWNKTNRVTLFIQVHTPTEDVDGLDDVENSLLYYNQAIIHYHMRQYSEAISIGEKLYQFLEPFGMLWWNDNAFENVCNLQSKDVSELCFVM